MACVGPVMHVFCLRSLARVHDRVHVCVGLCAAVLCVVVVGRSTLCRCLTSNACTNVCYLRHISVCDGMRASVCAYGSCACKCQFVNIARSLNNEIAKSQIICWSIEGEGGLPDPMLK